MAPQPPRGATGPHRPDLPEGTCPVGSSGAGISAVGSTFGSAPYGLRTDEMNADDWLPDEVDPSR